MKRENIKYVVLGIGLGFLIAAGLFLKFGGREKEILAEREIVERARSLGMVFLTEGQPTDGSDKAPDSVIQPQEPRTKEPESKSAEGNPAAKSSEEKSADEAKEDAGKQPDVPTKDEPESSQSESNKANDQSNEPKPEQPVPLDKPQEIVPPKQLTKPQTAPAKPASDVVTEVISGDDPAAKDLLPPPNPNRPKSTETLPTNHF